jgi:hypothetical protein
VITPDDRLSPRDHVFAREFDGELVILDLDGGLYYGLDEIASAAWTRVCDQKKSIREAVSDMLARYEVDEQTLMNDIVALATEWITKGLVQQVTA